MNRNIFGQIILSIVILNSMLYCQQFEPRNKIRIIVTATVARSSVGFSYSYGVSSSQESEQSVWQFWIISSVPRDSIRGVSTIQGWTVGIPENEVYASIRWGSPDDRDIRPGESRSGFKFDGSILPGIVDYYAEGYAPPPRWEASVEEDTIRGYDDLTPYGPGVVGKTVGPVLPPEPFVALAFLDTLISYKHQAFALGWVKNQGIVTSLDAKLENAKAQLRRNNKTAARNILQSFVNEVEAQKDKHLTSEAYALLKFNAEYLISKL